MINIIVDKLIKINKSKKSLKEIIMPLIDEKDEIKIMYEITIALAQKGYYIESIDPFELKK